MAFKNIKTTHWTLKEVNDYLQQNFDAKYWAFLIAQLSYKEVQFDKVAEQIIFAEYLPIRTLIIETLGRIKQGEIVPMSCEVCQQFFDVNKQEGIFGDTHHLKRFVCKTCSQKLSAWEFYHQYLKID